jgi:hypothetical protein
MTAISAPEVDHTVESIRARLDLVRLHMTEHIGASFDDSVDPLFNDAGALGAAVEALLVDHANLRIYGECSHDHADGDPAVVAPGYEGTNPACDENLLGTVCQLCCAEQGEQSMECREHHHWHRGEDPVVCHVRKTIADALNGAKS